MPFTFAHSAAVIPIHLRWGRYFSLTGLVLGSMAPDLEYFLHFKPHGVIGHTLLGFFYLNFPLVILLAWIFHRVIKEPFITHLPRPFSQWYRHSTNPPWKFSSVRKFFVLFYSSILGMFTHVLWDAFTHSTGFFVEHLPFLRERFHILSLEIPFYKVAQHSSTLIGFLILAAYLYSRKNTSPRKPEEYSPAQKLWFWASTGALAFLFFIYLFLFKGGLSLSQVGEIVVSLINCGFFSLVCVAWLHRRLPRLNEEKRR
ncbi:DUF4184 family protein [Salinithrix halophila]|uniref:DUF4184 family protein n=1 Tax=Salinithrix halophila TaxID=1485204 RepID=A0ABV8JDU7_9BACL